MKRAISLRWFRVLQALNLIKGQGGEHEKFVDVITFSKFIFCLDISHSPCFLVENSGV